MNNGAPSISIRPNPKPADHVQHAISYRTGYLDAMNSVDSAIQLYVTTLRTLGWKDQDILKALIVAIHGYCGGKGLRDTTDLIMKKYTGKETYGK